MGEAPGELPPFFVELSCDWDLTLLDEGQSMRTTIGSAFALLMCALLSGSCAFAQTHSTQPIRDFSRIPDTTANHAHYQPFDKTPLKFSSHVHNVLVPVIVLDKDGKNVPGLTKDEFRIFENGKEQKVASVEEIKASTARVTRTVAAPNDFTNELSSAGGEQKRITVIALDLINTPFLDQSRAREAMIRYIGENLQPDMLVELVTIESTGVRVIHDFSSDPAVLLRALERVKASNASTSKVDRAEIGRASCRERV